MEGKYQPGGMNFGFRSWIRARTTLLMLLSPESRIIAIKIQPFFGSLSRNGHAIIVFNKAFRQNSKILPIYLCGITPNHQTWLIRMLFPLSIWIRNAHLQHPSVTIYIFLLKTG